MQEYNPNCPKLEDLNENAQIEIMRTGAGGHRFYIRCPIPVPEAFGESI